MIGSIVQLIRAGKVPSLDVSGELSYVQLVQNPYAHGKAIFVLLQNGQDPVAVVKLPRSAVAAGRLDRLHILYTRSSDPDALREIMPVPLIWEKLGGQPVWIEEFVDGASLASLRGQAASDDAAMASLAQFYRCTAVPGNATSAAFVQAATTGEIDEFARCYGAAGSLKHACTKLRARLEELLAQAGPITLCASHGDFWRGNLFRCANGRVKAIDWDFNRAIEFPLIDCIHYHAMSVYTATPPSRRLAAVTEQLDNLADGGLLEIACHSFGFLDMPPELVALAPQLYCIKLANRQREHFQDDCANGFITPPIQAGAPDRPYRELIGDSFWMQICSQFLPASR